MIGDDFIPLIKDWNFEERLSKEFESVGFFISDHPLNQFKEIFNDYNIVDYQKFNSESDIKDTNVAATLLKVQERKTSKGNAYAILKLTDSSSVFELFIFSEILETNRNILKEGNSLILTVNKSLSDENNRFKRVNVKRIVSIKDLLNKPIKNITFNLNSAEDLDEISKFLISPGETKINIKINDNNRVLDFNLQNGRKIDRKSINLIRNKHISAVIS